MSAREQRCRRSRRPRDPARQTEIPAQICRRSHREGRDGAAIGHAEQHPAVEERGQIAVRFAQVDVLSAGVGKHRTQFGEGEAGAERDQRAQHPDQQKQHRLRQRPGNIFCGQKNRRADDAADQQQTPNRAGRVREPGWAWTELIPMRVVVRWPAKPGWVPLSDPEFVGRFQRSSAAPADDGGAVAASQRIGDFLAHWGQ